MTKIELTIEMNDDDATQVVVDGLNDYCRAVANGAAGYVDAIHLKVDNRLLRAERFRKVTP